MWGKNDISFDMCTCSFNQQQQQIMKIIENKYKEYISKMKKPLAHSVLCVPCSLLTHRHTHRLSPSHRHTHTHTHTLARAPVSHWTLSTCDVCIMHWWRVGLLTTTCSTDYMWRNHQRSDLSCLGGRWQRGWESGGVGDSAKVFTRRLASGWTIAGQDFSRKWGKDACCHLHVLPSYCRISE